MLVAPLNKFLVLVISPDRAVFRARDIAAGIVNKPLDASVGMLRCNDPADFIVLVFGTTIEIGDGIYVAAFVVGIFFAIQRLPFSILTGDGFRALSGLIVISNLQPVGILDARKPRFVVVDKCDLPRLRFDRTDQTLFIVVIAKILAFRGVDGFHSSRCVVTEPDLFSKEIRVSGKSP